MYAELLQSGRIKKPEKIDHYLSVIVTESQRLTRLVNNILDFSRKESDKLNFQLQKHNLAEIIQDIMLEMDNRGPEYHTRWI